MGRTSAKLGDTAPYVIERKIEDIGAPIAEAGGTASMYSHSSGAALALHAAAHGRPVAKLVLHEPPYVADSEEEQRTWQEIGEKFKSLLAEDRRGDAVELALTTGMPVEMVSQMRNEPWWAGMEAMASTIAYDSEVMGDISMGSTIPTDLLGAVTMPALVLAGPRRGGHAHYCAPCLEGPGRAGSIGTAMKVVRAAASGNRAPRSTNYQ